MLKIIKEAVLREYYNFKWKVSSMITPILPPEGLTLKTMDSSHHIDTEKDILRSSVMFSVYAPLIIESYICLYGLYTLFTIVKTIILIPV
jgi:hypothetical protein